MFIHFGKLSVVVFFSSVIISNAQDSNYIPKLVIKEKQVFTLSVDSIFIDTLIMLDGSIIDFSSSSTKILIEHAFIGKNCKFNASGNDGKNGVPYAKDLEINGRDGEHGKDLYIVVRFESLGSLMVNTNGGKGGAGGAGKFGVSGEDIVGADGGPGQNGGDGGNGGNAGALSLYYVCNGFTPVINQSGTKWSSIQVFYFGGKYGSGGRGGPGGRGGVPVRQKSYTPEGKVVVDVRGSRYGKRGINGVSGSSGNNGKDGELRLKRLE